MNFALPKLNRMKLVIKPQAQIKELNKILSKEFPFLKLQFYRSLNADTGLSYKAHRVPENLRLCDVLKIVKEGTIEIGAFKTVEEVEKEFQSKHGLTVQVLRKSEVVWLETRQTDNLTLDQQNAIGAEASRPIRVNRYTLFL